ncbi:MAG: NAD(P)/FAD-dependent oxidoreductase [Pseudobdellovibrionaceae bacterium]
MDSQKRVLILGGGVGGVVSAHYLRKLLPRPYRITVVDREAEQVFAPSLLWLMIGGRKAKSISRPLKGLNKKGVEFIHGRIEKISPQNKSVVVSGQELKGDAVVISLGADTSGKSVPGLEESGHSMYSLGGASSIYEKLKSFRAGKIILLTAAPVYKCPAAPYEAAMLIEYACRRQGIRDKVQIELYAAEPGPMGTAGPEVSAAVRKMVEDRGVKYFPSHQVVSVQGPAQTISFAGGIQTKFDLLFYVPVHTVPQVVKEAGLTSESGWISVDRHTLETKFDGVFAIGDVTSIPLKMGKPLPKAGVFAHAQAEIVANNLATKLTGSGEIKHFDGRGQCFIETGDHKAGIGKGNFFAEPTPQMDMKAPSLKWHIGKILFEKYWLWKWF